MRGELERQMPLFHVFEVEDRIRPDHPLRDIKRRTDRILASLDDRFAKSYSHTGRPSVPPERLLKAMLLMCLYTIRSEQQLCEQIDVNLLYQRFDPRDFGERGERNGRTRRGDEVGDRTPRDARAETEDAGRGQGIRRWRLFA